MIILLLYFTFLKIGLFSIGGGYVMLPLIEKEIISVHGWLTPAQFVDIVAIAEMTPGPVAINSATFIGYRTAGFWGSVFATAGVVTPSIVIILLVARLMQRFYQNPRVQAAFAGLRPAVIGLIASAAVFVARTTLSDVTAVLFAVAAFLLLTFTRLHPILVLVLAAVGGILLYG